MRLEHFAVYVSNLEAVRDFYLRYFHAKAGSRYRNAKTGFESYFLSFDDSTRLEIMTCPELDSQKDRGARTGYAHMAFAVGDRAEVDRLTALLQREGVCVVSGPRTTGDGYYESCVLDPEGNRVEIVESPAESSVESKEEGQ